ncbi:MAG: hypothetical protein E7594_07100 [Ruminococcaceae bacterium]|nr:hypothetical protein [Oscillospiraceae bacterium]
MKRILTKLAGLSLLSHLAYTGIFILLMSLATLLEKPSNNEGFLYMTFCILAILILVLYPLATAFLSACSVTLSSFALKKREVIPLNVIFIVLSVLYTVFAIWLSAVFWQGAMGV